ncbi:MAG: sigma-70 family RNA polymerase sigma factor, partial [Acutalibacteraceae bacterium]|nr:sigma-70 family RNA polymerase sigma factor [Acutalibacteraceae bacterium]
AYYHDVFRYCYSASKNNYHDAEEITQEVFLVFTKKLKTLEDDIVEHWLISVAKKKCLEYYRRLKKHDMVIYLEDSFTSVEDVLSTMTRYYSVSDVELQMTIDAIRKMLTEEENQLFVKKFIEKKKQIDIAKEMGISVSNVSTKTARLREKIEKLGFFCFTFAGQIIIKSMF